jgi:hypothetical protein
MARISSLNMKVMPPLSQVDLRQMLPYQRGIPGFSFSTRTIPPRMSGIQRGHTSGHGLQEARTVLLLAERIMPTLLLESTSTFTFFSPLS